MSEGPQNPFESEGSDGSASEFSEADMHIVQKSGGMKAPVIAYRPTGPFPSSYQDVEEADMYADQMSEVVRVPMTAYCPTVPFPFLHQDVEEADMHIDQISGDVRAPLIAYRPTGPLPSPHQEMAKAEENLEPQPPIPLESIPLDAQNYLKHNTITKKLLERLGRRGTRTSSPPAPDRYEAENFIWGGELEKPATGSSFLDHVTSHWGTTYKRETSTSVIIRRMVKDASGKPARDVRDGRVVGDISGMSQGNEADDNKDGPDIEISSAESIAGSASVGSRDCKEGQRGGLSLLIKR